MASIYTRPSGVRVRIEYDEAGDFVSGRVYDSRLVGVCSTREALDRLITRTEQEMATLYWQESTGDYNAYPSDEELYACLAAIVSHNMHYAENPIRRGEG